MSAGVLYGGPWTEKKVVFNCSTFSCCSFSRLEYISLPSFCENLHKKGKSSQALQSKSWAIWVQSAPTQKWRLDSTRITYHFLWCGTPAPQCFHTSGGYTVLFSVCGTRAREETETVNLLSKKRHRKMERRRAAKANFSRSVVFGRRTEGERDTLHLPLHLSLAPCTTSTFMSHSLHSFHLLFPLLHLLWSWGRQRPLAAGSPVQRRCEPSNRLSLPSGTSHTNTQLKGAMSSMLASINHYHFHFDTLV